MRDTGVGLQYLPRAGKVAYAAAIVTGSTLVTPSVNVGTWSVYRVSSTDSGASTSTPILLASLHGAQIPVRWINCRKNVFTERRVPLYMFMGPLLVELVTVCDPVQ